MEGFSSRSCSISALHQCLASVPCNDGHLFRALQQCLPLVGALSQPCTNTALLQSLARVGTSSLPCISAWQWWAPCQCLAMVGVSSVPCVISALHQCLAMETPHQYLAAVPRNGGPLISALHHNCRAIVPCNGGRNVTALPRVVETGWL